MINHEKIEKSDVIFMYYSDDLEIYRQFGTTMVAWGNNHGGELIKKLNEMGVHTTGAMWCLTAGAKRLYESELLLDATVRDIAGDRIIIPWQWDHVYEGMPTYWGCSHHPGFRALMRAEVCRAMEYGTYGLHVDDHLSNAQPAIEHGGCFCKYCMAAFAKHMEETGTPEELEIAGVESFAGFDYSALVRKYATTREEWKKVKESIPLYERYVDFQLAHSAENVRQLGRLASEIVERPVTLSANTCIPHIPHVAVTPSLTHLVGEVYQYAESGTARLGETIKAYRMAETLGKELAATAAGQDWAYLCANNCVNLVHVWIALSYACGQRLMPPVRAWCFTQELGTHWYYGTAENFAAPYRFVRAHRGLFDGFETIGPMAPPKDIPPSFETFEKRRALQRALAEGDPEPIRAGDCWVFPRENADGRYAVHLVNLAYDSATDSHIPQKNVKVRLDGNIIGRRIKKAEYCQIPGGDMREISFEQSSDFISFCVPEVECWSVAVLYSE